MASAFVHAVASVAIGKLSFLQKVDWEFWALGAFCAVIPYADVLAFKFGIPYEIMWGHRGITYSLSFAVLLSLWVWFAFYRQEKLRTLRGALILLFFILATASHAILDAMTTGGLGIAFFAPFHNERYFLAFRPIAVSPIGIKNFFSEWGWRVVKSEFI
jgi:inner membrane protein